MQLICGPVTPAGGSVLPTRQLLPSSTPTYRLRCTSDLDRAKAAHYHGLTLLPPLPSSDPHRSPLPTLNQQAKLHERLGQRAEAAHYHDLNLQRIDGEGLSGQDAVEALTFLADFHKVVRTVLVLGGVLGWAGLG